MKFNMKVGKQKLTKKVCKVWNQLKTRIGSAIFYQFKYLWEFVNLIYDLVSQEAHDTKTKLDFLHLIKALYNNFKSERTLSCTHTVHRKSK